jgi:creatinine amidohydrolase
MTRRYRWADFKTTEFEGLDPQKVIAVLPTAAIEQHGPHLPVGVDTFLNEGMLSTVESLLPELAPDLDVRILPVQAIGKSNEHLHARGTLTCPPTWPWPSGQRLAFRLPALACARWSSPTPMAAILI